MPQWPRLRCSVKDKSTNPLAFVYFLKCHHLPRPFANTQTGTCSHMGGANFVNTCIISPVLQPCSPVLQGSLQPPDFDGELFIHSFVWAVVGVVVLCCIIVIIAMFSYCFPHYVYECEVECASDYWWFLQFCCSFLVVRVNCDCGRRRRKGNHGVHTESTEEVSFTAINQLSRCCCCAKCVMENQMIVHITTSMQED